MNILDKGRLVKITADCQEEGKTGCILGYDQNRDEYKVQICGHRGRQKIAFIKSSGLTPI